MPRLSPLPEQLSYLKPFRRKFARRPLDELNEDTGGAELIGLLSIRLKGYTAAEAQKILEKDSTALAQWLADPLNENDCLQFVRGYFLVTSTEELAKRILSEAASSREQLPSPEMDLPQGAKVRRVKSRTQVAMIIRWQGTLTAFDVVPEEAAASIEEAEKRNDGESQLTVLPIRFGQVTGTKFVRTGESWRGPCKDVRYFLSVPGGVVSISTAVVSKKIDESKWDESEMEKYFHTLRVVRIEQGA